MTSRAPGLSYIKFDHFESRFNEGVASRAPASIYINFDYFAITHTIETIFYYTNHQGYPSINALDQILGLFSIWILCYRVPYTVLLLCMCCWYHWRLIERGLVTEIQKLSDKCTLTFFVMKKIRHDFKS